MTIIYPVIMCGGAGTRLWPLSRKSNPKQYHALTSERTMLQETVQRMARKGRYTVAAPSFVCARDDETVIKAQCQAIGVTPLHIILEPMGRNTAPVAAIIAEVFTDVDPGGLVLLVPADHYIEDSSEFWNCVEEGIKTAKQSRLVTLGIKASSPETGYGYIRQGKELAPNVYHVDAFVEKPDLETANEYLQSGDYVWNAGIFLFSPQTMAENFAQHAPEILRVCQLTLKRARLDDMCIFLDEATFAACPSDALDYAIMEKSDNVAVVAPVDVGWNDIGSWSVLADLNQKKTGASGGKGDIIALECANTYLHSDGPLVAGVGLENLIVIATKDAVLVLPKDRAQDVKKIVEKLKRDGRMNLC